MKVAVLFVGVYLAALMVACGGSQPKSTPTPALTTVTGSFILFDYVSHIGDRYWDQSSGWGEAPEGGPCQGRGGYSDISAGTEVRLKAEGLLIDVGRLGEGIFGPSPTSRFEKAECRFTFELDVEPGHRFYTVEVGRRGEYSYSYEEILAPGILAFTLGGTPAEAQAPAAAPTARAPVSEWFTSEAQWSTPTGTPADPNDPKQLGSRLVTALTLAINGAGTAFETPAEVCQGGYSALGQEPSPAILSQPDVDPTLREACAEVAAVSGLPWQQARPRLEELRSNLQSWLGQ